MTTTAPTIADEIERYLRTGDTDPYFAAWPGSFPDNGRRARADLRGALVREVKRLSEGRTAASGHGHELVALTKSKVEPMVRGLFPRVEQQFVLATLERAVVVITSENIESIITSHVYDGSAWTLANLCLASIDAELLADDAPRLVGLSEETTCYVTPEAFEDEPFADFIVHEAAHIFHNCKRKTIGLTESRTKEWLLDIDYRKRETFEARASKATTLSSGDDPGLT